jgi:hypothetical protein
MSLSDDITWDLRFYISKVLSPDLKHGGSEDIVQTIYIKEKYALDSYLSYFLKRYQR